jgi:hypothetical protein
MTWDAKTASEDAFAHREEGRLRSIKGSAAMLGFV